MEYIFTTDAVPEDRREVCWRNEFLRVFESTVQVERDQRQPFQGRIRSRSFGAATLVNVHLLHEDDRPHVIRHDPRPPGHAGRPNVYVLAKLSGQSRYHYDGGCKRGGPGDVLLFDGGQAWASESPRGTHQTLVLKLDRDQVLGGLGVEAPPAVWALRAEQKLGGLVESYLRSLARIDARQARALGPQLIEHFHALLAMAIQANLRSRPQAQAQGRALQLETIREHAEQHLGDPTLSPESVAARFGISTRYLHKLHAEHGQSFSKWLLQRRLEWCRRDIDDPTSGQRSITEIALSRGFNDLTHFGRCFRAAYGLTPREWRQLRPVRDDLRGRSPMRMPTKTRATPAKLGSRRRTGHAPGWFGSDEVARLRDRFSRVVVDGAGFAAAFYDRLFAGMPDVRPLFRGDMAEQGAKLLRMLALLVAKADAPQDLIEPLGRLGERHVGYGVSAAHYPPLGEVLLETLAERLGEEFDGVDRDLWGRLYSRVAEVMCASVR